MLPRFKFEILGLVLYITGGFSLFAALL